MAAICERRGRTRRRGMSLVEGLIASVLLSFVVAASGALLVSSERQQRLARNYSLVQTDLREALRRTTRTLRSGKAVLMGDSLGDSSATQVVVRVPEPSGAPMRDVAIRFHVAGGVLYAQRADEPAPGEPLLTGVADVSFQYYRTLDGSRMPVNGAPATATEVEVTLTARRGARPNGMGRPGSATASACALVALRNVVQRF